MISFLNDYNELAHPKILQDMLEIQSQANIGYGEDDHSINAQKHIKKVLKNDDLDIHFIHGGTAANILAIQSSLRSFDSVISCDTGHIVGHENGAIEAIGHQIIQVKNQDGKLTSDLLSQALEDNNEEYSTNPRLVYLSNATELGTVYTKKELEDISRFCKKNSLYLYMDGARLGSALASDYCDYTIDELVNIVDIFTIGGTKNGFMFGEALVITNPDLKLGIRKIIKQRGAMLAKGFALGVQFETMFKDGLYFSLAEDSIDFAKKLSKAFEDNNIKLYKRQESNLVFPILNTDLYNRLEKEFMFEKFQLLDEDKIVARFVTKYSTKKEDIEQLRQRLEDYNARS